MTKSLVPQSGAAAFSPANELLKAWSSYWTDRMQRTVLTTDVLRQRGNIYLEHGRAGNPPVLVFDYEMVVDGRQLERPANYALVRIVPPEGCQTDPKKRPFVVIDPRAGHGPGIGGTKIDSEIGIALRGGHPCYLVMFFPDPVPGQTIECIARAEVEFLKKVLELHPEREGMPLVIGNCQGGWALMLLAAMAPDLVGPVLLAGTPLSYWSGVEGKNPMRYNGGLMGGSWLASLMGDLGDGKFDGAWLVHNFEQLNPANTYWGKPYRLFSKVDTEAPRFLDFERWWGGHFLLNREEIDWIVQNLFVGNRLTGNELTVDGGKYHVDLRNIRTPIIVFASWGDNITPPQQALNWIPDLYADA
jgi:pimeloyl-ACP methyl ester carboxylesterase